MSFNDSSLWQNILSPDQRWMPTRYESFCTRSIKICKQISKPVIRCPELNNEVIQQKHKLNHVKLIQSSLAEFKSGGDVSRVKFSESLRQCPAQRKATVLKVDVAEAHKEKAKCFGRPRFNHQRGNVLMFPQLQQHMKEANWKYLVTYRSEDHGGPGEARELVLVPRMKPEVAVVEVMPEEMAVGKVMEEDEEKEETDEVGEEEVMKELASEKRLSVEMKAPGCWIDNATVSSLSGRSNEVFKVPIVDKRDAQSPQGALVTQGDKSSDENNKQRLTPSPNDSDSTEEAPPTAIQTTQARSSSENPEGTQNTQPPELEEEPPLEKTELSSIHEPDTNTIHSWLESDKAEGGPSEPVPPTYICPSSSSKSHETEIKKWLKRTTFSSAPGLLPLL